MCLTPSRTHHRPDGSRNPIPFVTEVPLLVWKRLAVEVEADDYTCHHELAYTDFLGRSPYYKESYFDGRVLPEVEFGFSRCYPMNDVEAGYHAYRTEDIARAVLRRGDSSVKQEIFPAIIPAGSKVIIGVESERKEIAATRLVVFRNMVSLTKAYGAPGVGVPVGKAIGTILKG